MALVRPRLTDYHGISAAQAELGFAIPFFEEDIPLYLDPFLLWKSPSQQDNALHTSLVNSFNRQNWLVRKGREDEAVQNLIIASECDEVGMGVSATRRGKRIGAGTAREIVELFRRIPEYGQFGFTHFEEIQLYVDGISRDRISDIACNFLKSFLIDYTVEQCLKLDIPIAQVRLATLHDYKKQKFIPDVKVDLPINPQTGAPLLLVPKRWLRFVPWINFDDYFATACPKDDIISKQGSDERVQVLLYNRDNYGMVAEYIRAKELQAMFREFQEAAKKKPDSVLNKRKVEIVNRLLRDVHAILEGETTRAYLDLLDEDELPQNSDVVLIVGQAVAAMEAFKEKYHGWLPSISRHDWATEKTVGKSR